MLRDTRETLVLAMSYADRVGSDPKPRSDLDIRSYITRFLSRPRKRKNILGCSVFTFSENMAVSDFLTFFSQEIFPTKLEILPYLVRFLTRPRKRKKKKKCRGGSCSENMAVSDFFFSPSFF